MDNFLPIKNIDFLDITVQPDYNIQIVRSNRYLSVKRYPHLYFSKDHYYDDSPYDRIFSASYTRIYSNYIFANKTLYISPDSKLQRDLVRNSGYKITYSEDKADFKVIPRPKGEEIRYYANMVVFNTVTEDLYVCNINNLGHNTKYTADDFLEYIAEFLDIEDKSTLDYYSNDSALNSFPIWFFKGCKEYGDILKGGSGSNYILDSALPLTPVNKMSVETLDLWRRLVTSDDNMLEKSILNSDARDYPFTLYNFLQFDSELRYRTKPQKVRWMMENMGIGGNDWPSDKQVEPKDLNLIQDYISYLLGLEGKSGYVTAKQFNNLPYQYQRLLMTKFAVCPVRIDCPTTFANIQAAAKNS